MPELPEVETTRRGLEPHVVGRRIRDVVVRNRNLRWPVPRGLARTLRGEEVRGIRRRGKYLLFDMRNGHLLVHLGMSGRLTLVPESEPARKHDHVDVRFEGSRSMRLTDPRRFGAMLWLAAPAEGHALLKGLGLEPFDDAFHGAALHKLARGRKVAVKNFLMNARVVTGVGNIYASEALFRARVDPRTPAGRISAARWERIATAVRAVQLGASNYLTKPIWPEDLERALAGELPTDALDPEQWEAPSLARHEREYIEYVLAQSDGNVSQAARRLGLHRQSLQRKLRKFTPR